MRTIHISQLGRQNKVFFKVVKETSTFIQEKLFNQGILWASKVPKAAYLDHMYIGIDTKSFVHFKGYSRKLSLNGIKKLGFEEVSVSFKGVI